MRNRALSTVLALAIAALTAGPVRPDTATITPSQPGHIFTVINFARTDGRAQATTITVAAGKNNRYKVVAPYRRCRESFPSGVVLKMRIPEAGGDPITLDTDGTIVRPPSYGEMPPEVQHPCYELVAF
jgi:hypothetical protein